MRTATAGIYIRIAILVIIDTALRMEVGMRRKWGVETIRKRILLSIGRQPLRLVSCAPHEQ